MLLWLKYNFCAEQSKIMANSCLRQLETPLFETSVLSINYALDTIKASVCFAGMPIRPCIIPVSGTLNRPAIDWARQDAIPGRGVPVTDEPEPVPDEQQPVPRK